jgi:segregation and condensation protein B
MDISTIIPHIEALIFASDKPLTALELTEYVNNALGFIEDRASLDQVETAIEGIKEKYDTEFYAFELKQSGGGLQFLTKAAYHKTVALINGDKFIKKLSTASLETLAIIAYKQPITKSEIESIRGVNCDYAVQKLLEQMAKILLGHKRKICIHRCKIDYYLMNLALLESQTERAWWLISQIHSVKFSAIQPCRMD